jgi:hypothetical protein
MPCSAQRTATGAFALLTLLAAGGGLLAAHPAPAPTGLVKSVQCPPGYELNPQNTQQCVPMGNPFGGSSVPPGSA